MKCYMGRTHDPHHRTCLSCELQGAMTCETGVQPLPQSKYRNKPVVVNGLRFDSKKEGERYSQLMMLSSVGKISNLRLQVSFELAPGTTIAGKKKQPLRYVADFQYIKEGVTVVEDVKGMLTDVYKLKRHLMKTVHNIEIQET